MMSQREETWSTKDEIRYIDRLAKKGSATRLLREYLSMTTKRAHFGDIDAQVVVPHAQKRLTEIELREASSMTPRNFLHTGVLK